MGDVKDDGIWEGRDLATTSLSPGQHLASAQRLQTSLPGRPRPVLHRARREDSGRGPPDGCMPRRTAQCTPRVQQRLPILIPPSGTHLPTRHTRRPLARVQCSGRAARGGGRQALASDSGPGSSGGIGGSISFSGGFGSFGRRVELRISSDILG